MWLTVLLQLLPSLIVLAEKLFGPKTGEVKKDLVMSVAEIAMSAVGSLSTGGQKDTWERIKPAVSTIIDAGVAIAFPHNPQLERGSNY